MLIVILLSLIIFSERLAEKVTQKSIIFNRIFASGLLEWNCSLIYVIYIIFISRPKDMRYV